MIEVHRNSTGVKGNVVECREDESQCYWTPWDGKIVWDNAYM